MCTSTPKGGDVVAEPPEHGAWNDVQYLMGAFKDKHDVRDDEPHQRGGFIEIGAEKEDWLTKRVLNVLWSWTLFWNRSLIPVFFHGCIQ